MERTALLPSIYNLPVALRQNCRVRLVVLEEPHNTNAAVWEETLGNTLASEMWETDQRLLKF